MLTMPFGFKKQLAAGLSIGCGLAVAIEMYGYSDRYYQMGLAVATYLLSAISLLLGFSSLPRLEADVELPPLRRFLTPFSRVGPFSLGGATIGFVTTILAGTLLRGLLPLPFLLMIVMALTSVPHMLLYLAGQPPLITLSTSPSSAEREMDSVRTTPEATSAADELSALRKQLAAARSRMLSEVGALARRGNLNLAIGIFTTLAAVSLLASIVFTAKVEYSSTASVLAYYIPRISFVAFVEVFAFFFLKLYRASLDGIKYFQNELTNIELRFVALETALLGDRSAALASLVAELAKTERNFVLKKGEATVELRRSELEEQRYKEVLSAVGNLLKGIKTK